MSTVVDAIERPVAAYPEDPVSPPLTVIEPRPGWRFVDAGELWRHRELLAFLIWRDVKVRYKQTVLGAAWAIIQPLATMLVFAVVLGRVAGGTDSSVPYPLFVFAGLLPWTFFSNAISSAGTSVVGNQNLITKVYFPRFIVPMGAVGACIVDFLIAFGMLLVLMLGYGCVPGPGFLAVPFLVIGLTVTALGIGTLLSALTVAYRDFRHVLPFMVQLWMFATPAIYLQNEGAMGSFGKTLLLANPANGFIVNFRAAMLGTPFDVPSLAASCLLGVLGLLVGCVYFRQVERTFAELFSGSSMRRIGDALKPSHGRGTETMQPAIRVEGLAKRYQLGARQQDAYRTLRESITDAVARPWGRLAAAVRPVDRSRLLPPSRPTFCGP